jgi:hypothetical protein
MDARRLGRLGIFAVGLGIGAAVASTPGIASADSATDEIASVLAAIDPFGAAAAAPTNVDISFDGFDLFNGGGSAVATTTPGDFDFAIAEGANAHAIATGGFFDYASADGTNAYAVAGGGAGTNFDSATDIGNNTTFGTDGAFAEGGSGNTAIDLGNNAGTGDGAFAGSGGLEGVTGNNDEALVFGNLTGAGSGSFAVDGHNDAASLFGSTTADTNAVFAGDGNGDLASVFGITSTAHAGGLDGVLGNNDVGFVFDPGGPLGSSADAGSTLTAAGSSDLASVFGDGFHATATGANNLVDLLPNLFGDTTTATTFAATDLSGLAADFSSFLGDIGSFFTF